MKRLITLKTEYTILILATLFWVSDFLMDLYALSGSSNSALHGVGNFTLIHLPVITAQLLFTLYVFKVAGETRVLEKSLETAKRATDLEAEKVNAIMEAMVDPVSVQNTDFIILYQNQAHQDLMGCHIGELCHRAYNGKETVCEGCHLARTFQEGTSFVKEVAFDRGGEKRAIEILSSPLKDGTGRTIAGIEVLRDITRRKEAEEEIRRLNSHLESHAVELTASYRELESFSYSVSHDLRTPLTRIYTAAQLLDEQHRDQLDEQGRFLARTVCEGTERMEELIKALLDLARVTSSSISHEEVDLAGCAREIISDLQKREPERTVSFSAPAELLVTGDRQLLTVLLENLLDNAWKYTGKTPAAAIELGIDVADGKTRYFVRDNGPGFDMTLVDNLFKPFRRLHATADFPGTGIGLATVHRIIQRHGGTVRAEGKPGCGATFFFSLRDGR